MFLLFRFPGSLLRDPLSLPLSRAPQESFNAYHAKGRAGIEHMLKRARKLGVDKMMLLVNQAGSRGRQRCLKMFEEGGVVARPETEGLCSLIFLVALILTILK